MVKKQLNDSLTPGQKRRDTILAKDPEFYATQGRKGGPKTQTLHGPKVQRFRDPQLAREASLKRWANHKNKTNNK